MICTMDFADIEEDGGNGAEIEKKFSLNSCKVLTELRNSGELCDAVLKVDETAFPIHRAILCACSPYFRALFTNQMLGSSTPEVKIPGISAAMLKLIIDFAYTRDVHIDQRNVEQLLPAADQFLVTGIVTLCCDFLRREISDENVIGIHDFARSYFCHSLERFAMKYLLQNFPGVYTNSNEFIQIGVDDLCRILESDYLNVKNEEIAFDAILRWINFDPDRRRMKMSRLLKTVRLGLLSSECFVEKVKAHPYIKDCEHCRPTVIETLKFLYDLDMDEGKEVDLSNPLAKPRLPHEVLFVIGGWSGGSPTSMVETYDTRADKWLVSRSIDSVPRAYHGTIALDHSIYIIGGFDGVEYYSSVRVYNPSKGKWSEVAPMNVKRCYVSVTVHNNDIYAMGGFDGHVRHKSAERYVKKINQWSLIQPMNKQRSDASSTTLADKIYICGGFNGQECLNSAESYDPTTNQWTLITDMRSRRSGVGVVAYNGYVYALGGFDGITRMNTAERFNVETRLWQLVPDMFNPRSNFALEVIDDMIFCIGGFNGVTTIFNVECYDACTEEWYFAADMNLYRSALSACVVRGLPNVKDFTHKERPMNDSEISKR